MERYYVVQNRRRGKRVRGETEKREERRHVVIICGAGRRKESERDD